MDCYNKSVDYEGIMGNYLVEVIFDGEVRVCMIIKMNIKKLFWWEDCEFVDFFVLLFYLLVLLKWIDGNMESFMY